MDFGAQGGRTKINWSFVDPCWAGTLEAWAPPDWRGCTKLRDTQAADRKHKDGPTVESDRWCHSFLETRAPNLTYEVQLLMRQKKILVAGFRLLNNRLYTVTGHPAEWFASWVNEFLLCTCHWFKGRKMQHEVHYKCTSIPARLEWRNTPCIKLYCSQRIWKKN